MNQRFQNEERDSVRDRYAGNKLFQAICSIGSQLEYELNGFGLCPEECFMEVKEILTAIAEKGEAFMQEAENCWLNKYNEYKRFDRSIDNDELRKVVGIVFAFVILTIDSSRYHFYRYKLTEQLMQTIANHKFNGWQSTLNQIFSVPLSDGWFDAFIDEEPEDGEDISLPKDLNTKKARKYFAKALHKGYMKKNSDGTYDWTGTDNKGNRSELAYFCGIIYGYVHTVSGNAGNDFPEESLNKLFGVSRLYSSLTQVYNAKKTQRWRSLIDEIF